MLLLDIINRVKDRSHKGDINVTTDVITGQILRAVNDARRDLIKFLPKHFLRVDSPSPLQFNTANGVLYSLDAICMAPIIFRYTFNNVEYILERLASEREYYQTLFIRSQAPNRPFFYVDKGLDGSGNRQIEIYPQALANTTFTINYTYYKDPTKAELTTSNLNTEFPDFPSYMQDAVWKGGLYYFLKNFDDEISLGRAEKDYSMATESLDEVEDTDQDLELQLRWGFGKINYRDPATGIRLI